MDLIYIKKTESGTESGYLKRFEVAFDVTTDPSYDTNQFELTMALPEDREGLLWAEDGTKTIIFAEGTEFGGEISGYTIDLSDGRVKYTGRTWRGTLSQWIIEPPPGEDYRIVSGNLQSIMDSLPLSEYIDVQPTEYTVGTYQFNRYVDVFSGMSGLMEAVSADLRAGIEFHEGDNGTGAAELTFQPARDLSDLIEVSQDYSRKVQLKITVDGSTPKELICLGSGELHEREVIKLYADDDWSISTIEIPGVCPVETYDFSSSENLMSDGMKHYQELISNHRQIELVVSDMDVRLSDIVAGKDLLTGEMVTAEVTSIIYRCTNYGDRKEESYEYKTKVRV